MSTDKPVHNSNPSDAGGRKPEQPAAGTGQTDEKAREKEKATAEAGGGNRSRGKDGRAGDAASGDAKAAGTSTAGAVKPGGRRGPSPFWSLLVIVALLAALAAAAGSYYVGERLAETRRVLEASQVNLEDRVGGLPEAQQQLQMRVERFGADLDELERQLESGVRNELGVLDQRLNALHKLLQETVAPVEVPADIEHLLQIANDSVILQRDVGTALAALRIADSRLRDIADPLFSETRQRIADEIGALEATPIPDIAGTAFAISSMQQGIEELPLDSLRSASGERAPPSLTATDDQTSGGWRALLNDMWQALRSLVVIRRSDEPQGPLIAPELRVYLNQNLYLELESARLALLSRDPENFRHHVEVVRDWLARYYDPDNPQVAAMLERLGGFMQLDINPEMPDLSGSLIALREALERRREMISGEGDNGNDSGPPS